MSDTPEAASWHALNGNPSGRCLGVRFDWGCPDKALISGDIPDKDYGVTMTRLHCPRCFAAYVAKGRAQSYGSPD